MRGLQLVDRWISRPRKPFAGLPKCPRGAGQKEVYITADNQDSVDAAAKIVQELLQPKEDQVT